MDLTDVVVRKPWGLEYLCFRNADVAIWVLHLQAGRRTSLHAHPHKNTALICLQGLVAVSFLRSSVRLAGLDKINVFRGRFHSIFAREEAVLLEVETPEDKYDLVRLEDDYGRVGTEYEGAEAHQPRGPEHLWLGSGTWAAGFDGVEYSYGGCLLSKTAVPPLELPERDIVVTLSGGLERGLLPAGDAIDGASFNRVAQRFPPVAGSQFLWISRQN